VGFNLLGEVFTMIELQSLYETILGTKLRRNNFQRKMLSLGILERVEKLYTGAANKAPYLYKFDDKIKN
jgi:8-oxo-dGTP diphosphatase